MSKINRLIFDLETSPLVAYTWRIGYRLSLTHDKIIKDSAIICACYTWEGSNKVHHLEWDKGDDSKLCHELMEVMLQADEIIAHNADGFDIKVANTRFLANGLDPSPIWKTVDTLVIARRRFKFDSNRLDFLGKFLFGEGKIKTDFGLWTDILEKNCPKAMAKMVKYCKQDVRLLAKVWKKLQPYHTPKTHAGVLGGHDKWTSPFSSTDPTAVRKVRKTLTAAGTQRHQFQCKETGGHYTVSQKAWEEYQDWKKEQKEKI